MPKQENHGIDSDKAMMTNYLEKDIFEDYGFACFYVLEKMQFNGSI